MNEPQRYLKMPYSWNTRTWISSTWGRCTTVLDSHCIFWPIVASRPLQSNHSGHTEVLKMSKIYPCLEICPTITDLCHIMGWKKAIFLLQIQMKLKPTYKVPTWGIAGLECWWYSLWVYWYYMKRKHTIMNNNDNYCTQRRIPLCFDMRFFEYVLSQWTSSETWQWFTTSAGPADCSIDNYDQPILIPANKSQCPLYPLDFMLKFKRANSFAVLLGWMTAQCYTRHSVLLTPA